MDDPDHQTFQPTTRMYNYIESLYTVDGVDNLVAEFLAVAPFRQITDGIIPSVVVGDVATQTTVHQPENDSYKFEDVARVAVHFLIIYDCISRWTDGFLEYVVGRVIECFSWYITFS